MAVIILDSYSESNYSVDLGESGGNIYPDGNGQIFLVSGGATLNSAKFYLKKSGSPTGNIVLHLYAITGTPGSTAIPTGVALATSDSVDISTLTTSYQLVTFTFSGGNQITLNGGTWYAISCDYTGGDNSNILLVGGDSTSPTHAGNRFFLIGTTYTADAATDCIFYVYGNVKTGPFIIYRPDLQ